MIKSFRRSSKRTSNSSSNNAVTSPISNNTRNSSSSSIQPKQNIDSLTSPTKVIRALYDYEPQGPGELKFNKGDFFHVVGNENDPDWYEACNPVSNTKGMVPVPYFESFQRSRPLSHAVSSPNLNNSNGKVIISNNNSHSNHNSYTNSSSRNSTANSSVGTLYAVTLYDFSAERPDELDIHIGENLIICAHHEFEWFIAKPIDRLGGPGLVPVSYVQVIDLLTGSKSNDTVLQIIEKFKLPTVEQWKNKTARYQASTIPLGTVTSINENDFIEEGQEYHEQQSPRQYNHLSQHFISNSFTTYIIDASVESFSLDNGRYRYLLKASLSNGSIRLLYRYYQDFYDMQVRLLEDFPLEAGKTVGFKRTLPSIPGPLINVNDSISNLRRRELDQYIKILINLPTNISKSTLVLNLFELRDYDRDFNNNDEFLNYVSNNITENLPLRSSQRLSSSQNPISQQSNYQQDRLSQYSKQSLIRQKSSDLNLDSPNSPTNASPTNRSVSSHSITTTPTSITQQTNQTSNSNSPTQEKEKKVKIKFFYEDDIFVLLIPSSVKLKDLKLKLSRRLNFDIEKIKLYLKNDYDDYLIQEIDNLNALKSFEIDNDDKFETILIDKVKLIIVVE